MPYIKSHSNYVLQQKHQDIKDGTIYERDITTIGGVDQFAPGQAPIFRSSNFIITTAADNKPSNQYNTEKWESNVSGTVWTLDNIDDMVSNIIEDNDTKIVLKQDYYELNDFAYYGSLTELFRASVTDILRRFPGELYVPSSETKAYYTSAITVDFERIEERIQLGKNGYINYVYNPFGIDIFSKTLLDDANPLKYFAENGWENYEVITNNSTTIKIVSWDVEYEDCSECKCKDALLLGDERSEKGKTSCCIGDKIATVTIGLEGHEPLKIDVWYGDYYEIIYLTNKFNYHIRPKRPFLDEFYNECDNFQKLLMNEDTHYKATFSVIKENDYGYYRELVPFQFPIGEGGYNIDASAYGFNDYTSQMVEIGEFYDERFTDNLWRSMTHESIKNFDWTYTREFEQGDEEEYVFGGQRIQKALRIFAREFDEILSYINNIKNINRVTYDERNNLPDYFLTDTVANSGWDVKLILPYSLTERDESGNTVEVYSESGGTCGGEVNNTLFDGNRFYRYFSQNGNSEFAPYSGTIAPSDDGTVCHFGVSYSDDTVWTHQQGNNEFLRRLKINSPYIWRTKGTVDGIEMILGIFGMRSERWLHEKKQDNYDGVKPDFKITEYTSFAHRIEESWDAVHQDYRINWINSTKTISYDNRFISNYNKNGLEPSRIPYQGIPLAYRDEYISKGDGAYLTYEIDGETKRYTNLKNEDVLKRYLYPNFNQNEQLDGNPYYQMDGGWLSKIVVGSADTYNLQFDVDNNIVYSKYINKVTLAEDGSFDDNASLYIETIRNIRRVDDVNGLLSIPTSNLYNGVICNVTRIEKDAVVIDGIVYPLYKDWYRKDGEESGTSVEYVSLIKNDGFIKVGQNKFFDTSIIVNDKYGEEVYYDIDEKADGYELKAYINDGNFVCKEDYEGNYSVDRFFDFKTWGEEDGYTNYFVLDDVNYADQLAKYDNETSGFTSGWRRLSEFDSEYLKINTIKNYYEGNNPHNGNMVYDNGHKYFTYYNRIFKYASDNELFDERCYDDFYASLDDEISKYGFSGLIEDNENILQYDSFLIEDSKIHYFGNYKTRNSDNTIDKVWIYGEDSERIDGFKPIYSGETKNENNINGYILSSDSMIGDNPYSGQTENGVVDEVTNQIVNNKRFLIDFYLHDEPFSKRGLEEMKYIDDIVMNYLTQMIPSSTILQIRYSKQSDE